MSSLVVDGVIASRLVGARIATTVLTKKTALILLESAAMRFVGELARTLDRGVSDNDSERAQKTAKLRRAEELACYQD